MSPGHVLEAPQTFYWWLVYPHGRTVMVAKPPVPLKDRLQALEGEALTPDSNWLVLAANTLEARNRACMLDEATFGGEAAVAVLPCNTAR